MNLGEKIIKLLTWLFVMSGRRWTKKFVDDYKKKLRFIEISENGLIINDINKVIEIDIKWHSVKDVIYYKDFVELHLNGDKEIIIPKEYYKNWHKLIKEIPKGYASYDYDSVKSYFASLKGCEICGLVAVDEENECNACGNEVWNLELSKEYESKETYIKEMQFDNFEPINENDKIEITNKPELGFDSYIAWMPYVKESDYKK